LGHFTRTCKRKTQTQQNANTKKTANAKKIAANAPSKNAAHGQKNCKCKK